MHVQVQTRTLSYNVSGLPVLATQPLGIFFFRRLLLNDRYSIAHHAPPIRDLRRGQLRYSRLLALHSLPSEASGHQFIRTPKVRR